MSDIGLRRSNNEDVWASLPELGFFVLADGMGGQQAGEVAARKAVDSLLSSIQESQKTQLSTDSNCNELIIEIKRAIDKANQKIYKLGKQLQEWSGMGTTLCCLLWTKERIVYAHIGDSRIYRLRQKKLELLTQDHSLFAKWLSMGTRAAECETPFPYKNVITRALGTSKRAKPEIAVSPHELGDLYFLSTDGLHDVLSTNEMEALINESKTLEKACSDLIEMAKTKGSPDNITLLMVKSE